MPPKDSREKEKNVTDHICSTSNADVIKTQMPTLPTNQKSFDV